MIERRKCERFIVPGATVSVRVRGLLGRLGPLPQEVCPVADLSKGGLSFLTDKAPKKGREVSLLLRYSEKESPLSLEGRIVYVGPDTGVSYKYRIGVQFKPFETERGANSPESLKMLDKLEKTYLPPMKK